MNQNTFFIIAELFLNSFVPDMLLNRMEMWLEHSLVAKLKIRILSQTRPEY